MVGLSLLCVLITDKIHITKMSYTASLMVLLLVCEVLFLNMLAKSKKKNSGLKEPILGKRRSSQTKQLIRAAEDQAEVARPFV